MVADRTLYDVLGVEPNADEQTISKAVRDKSLEHHPDRGGSVEMMQKVNAAKEILTHPEKRRIYDEYGLEGMKSRMTNGDFQFPGYSSQSIFDIFDFISRGSGDRENRRKTQGTDIKHVLKVSLEDLYLGSTKTVNVDRDILCADCKGTGSNDGIEHQCIKCGGAGFERLLYHMGPFLQQTQRECSLCHGQGNIIEKNKRCHKCFGKKVFREKKRLDVHIVHGSEHGETIKFLGQANQIPNGESGTLYVILKQEPHPIFHRNKDDLVMNMKINLTESLCGFRRLIKLLDNHQILINHPPGEPIKPNTSRSIKGYGMPNRHTHSHGDLIIHFDVEFPPKHFINSEKQRKRLEAILPPKSDIPLESQEAHEEVQMMDNNMYQEKFQNGYHHHQTEDDREQFQEEHQGVRCQTQ